MDQAVSTRAAVVAAVAEFIAEMGDVTLFGLRTLGWMVSRRPGKGTLLNSSYQIGVRSVGVVAVTGAFIGMVLAVQSYGEFTRYPGMKGFLGVAVNSGVLRELGPVLAAVMLAGRVGSAMAAELGTMRVTEQIDALWCLGANPIHYLVVPRFLACVLLIPLLTILADFMGVMGGAAICTHYFDVEPAQYWSLARVKVGMWDVFTGVAKSVAFGAVIAVVSCHRGFHATAGAEGVGKAATGAFVRSFVAILAFDFFLSVFFNALGGRLWPNG